MYFLRVTWIEWVSVHYLIALLTKRPDHLWHGTVVLDYTMGNIALMFMGHEDPLKDLEELLPGYLPETERIEAFLWANLCCLAEVEEWMKYSVYLTCHQHSHPSNISSSVHVLHLMKIDSPAEKQRILHSSNGALQSIRYFSAGNAYALTGLAVDSEVYFIHSNTVMQRRKSNANASFLIGRQHPLRSLQRATRRFWAKRRQSFNARI